MNELRERIRTHGSPVIDGEQVTFVWEGAAPAPKLIGDFTHWQASPVDLVESEPGLWTHTRVFPRDAYVEYSFVHLPDIEERVIDPFNPQVVWNGVDAVNHVLRMPDYAPTPLTVRQPGVPRGTVTRYFIEAGNLLATPHRRLHLYEPPVDDPVPLMVVWDGSDYLSRAKLNIIVDNLIAQGRIRPIALAFLDNGQQARMSEYFCSDATLAFLLEHLLPFASKHLNLLDIGEQPAAYGVMGASMGGLMSLYTGLRLPDIFGHVISESGAFFTDPRTVMLIDLLVESLPVKPLKIWQDVGTLEWLLEGNRAMHERLVRRGYRVTYHEYHGGHNYTMWSDMVWRGLEAMFGTK